jgi:DAACS family dicarboxylate/amino acid:cation (Na+ or H+) symporter
MSLHTKILLGLVLGAVTGVLLNLFRGDLDAWVRGVFGEDREIVKPLLRNVLKPIGDIFLALLFMTVVPMVFASLAVGVARLGDLSKLGRIGAKTFGYFVVTMTLAVLIGLSLVHLVQPGSGLPEETKQKLQKEFGQQAAREKEKAEKQAVEFDFAFVVNLIVNMVPRRPLEAMVRMDMLQVICFALLFGIGLTLINPQRAEHVLQFLEGVSDVMVAIIGIAMKLAPYGVFALVCQVSAELGFEVIRLLGLYVFVVITGLTLQMFGVFSLLVWSLSRLNPLVFFQRVRDIMLTAFSTSSSNATLPTTIKVSEEELGVPPQIAGFVLPLGATMNMNGTALFEGVTVVFLAQVFGIELSLGQQVIIILMSVLTAIGAAGVPGGSLPLLVMVLDYAGVPAGGIALILGVDRILDMCRTTLNVIGDVTAATFVARTEGYELLKPPAPPEEIPYEPEA